jgi:hypothetical protein
MIPESPLIGEWLEKLQKDISVIKIELLDEKAKEKTAEYRQWQGQRSGAEPAAAALRRQHIAAQSDEAVVDDALDPLGIGRVGHA